MQNKIWIDIKNYEGIYKISNNGEIYSLLKNKNLKPGDNGKGYLFVHLFKEGIKKSFYIHRLVAFAFINNSENKKQVNHIDCDKSNNNVENLEWSTSFENMQHASKNGKLYSSDYQKKQTSLANRGEKSHLCKITEKEAMEIKIMIKEGVKTQKQISKEMNVTRSNISAIKRGKSWKHIIIN